MKKSIFALVSVLLFVLLVGCDAETSDNLPLTEYFADDYMEYPTTENADDYFKQCYEKLEGEWYNDEKTIGFYIEDNMYMMSGWTDNARIIAYIEPVSNHENQFRIGLEAGELQENLRVEFGEDNKSIIINETEYVRKEKDE